MHPPADAVLPDYTGGSIVNLVASITAGLGGEPLHPPAALLPPREVAAARHVLLLTIDGLGHGFLARREGVLRRHLRGRLTSVFPSTTASAIPSLMTGLTPAQHGLTGWHMYFRELGAIATPLPFHTRVGHQPLAQAGVDARGLLDLKPLADRLPVPCHVLAPQTIAHSPFNAAIAGRAMRHGYEGLEEMFALITRLMRLWERSYIFAYWPELDRLAHHHGIASRAAEAAFAALDATFGRFLETARGMDTLILVTADHGFLDTTPEAYIDLEHHPALTRTLLLPLCGEGRVAYAYVRAGREAAFAANMQSHLAERVVCHPSAEVIAAGWLGPGPAHAALADRLGDYVLIPRGRGILRDWVLGEERYTHVGVHGGWSEDEMGVPLVVVRT